MIVVVLAVQRVPQFCVNGCVMEESSIKMMMMHVELIDMGGELQF